MCITLHYESKEVENRSVLAPFPTLLYAVYKVRHQKVGQLRLLELLVIKHPLLLAVFRLDGLLNQTLKAGFLYRVIFFSQ